MKIFWIIKVGNTDEYISTNITDYFILGLACGKDVGRRKDTYLHTAWSRVLLEKLKSSQLVKKFPAFYGTPRFITAFTSARHLSLS